VRRIGQHLGPTDRILVGVDLRKEAAVLVPAYDDAQGITARFNRNILVRMNATLGGNFQPERFDHRASYDAAVGRIQMHLVSKEPQRVRFDRLDRDFEFAAGEAIHTEDSYKYSLEELAILVRQAGLRIDEQWLDASRRFSVTLLRP
jgi:uncharacterized SAM-dependent methyltransferase